MTTVNAIPGTIFFLLLNQYWGAGTLFMSITHITYKGKA